MTASVAEHKNTSDAIHESRWMRSEFVSVWIGPDLELICVQSAAAESWRWTARGWRQPDDDWAADRQCWVEAVSRKSAEAHAMRFYMENDE